MDVARQPQLIYSMRDDSGTLAMLRFSVRRREAAMLMAGAAASRPILAGISDCVAERWAVTYGYTTTAAQPNTGAQNKICGLFVFSTVEPGQYAVCALPGIRQALVLTEGPMAGVGLNTDAPEVQAFVSAMIAGVWCNPFGVQIAQLEAAFVQIRV